MAQDKGAKGRTIGGKPATAIRGKTMAQEQLEQFRARSGSAAPSPFEATTPWVMPSGPGGPPRWALPPSLVPYPGVPGMGTSPFAMGSVGGGIIDRVGSTLGLGLDIVNELLAGSVRMLQGVAGSYYGYDHSLHAGCECGSCGCCDPCLTKCCGYDCCCVMGVGNCCRPSVGNCC